MKKRKATTRKARKSYVSNPAKKRSRRRYKSNPGKPVSRRRRYKRNPGDTPKDIAILAGSAIVAAVAGPKLAGMAPVSPLIANLAMIGAGGAPAYLGRRQTAAVGAGIGLAMAGATRALLNQFPALAGDEELTQEEQSQLLEQLSASEDIYGNEQLSGPLAGPLAGPLSGSLSGMNAAAM